MAYRYSRKDLEAAVAGLNNMLGFAAGHDVTPEGRWAAVPGAYALDGNIGGWRLVQYCNAGGGCRDITPRASVRDAYDLIWAYRHGVEAGLRAAVREASNA